MKKLKLTAMILGCSLIGVSISMAQDDIGNYLLVGNIGNYEVDTAHKIKGNAGVLISSGHFFRDHIDTTYKTGYYNFNIKLGVEVQVTQHAGSESDRWLLHEVERDFRTYYGLPDDSFVVRQIDNNTILGLSVAGWTYRWVSGNKVIQIQYHDSQMIKPEPLEVVKAYLAKHPSTLTPMTSADLRNKDNETKWLKDEMERRLWLCDKWFMAFQLGKVQQGDMLEEMVKSMNLFLDYREKYYGIKAADEKNLLSNYLLQNNGTGIKVKLDEYKKWWSENKVNPINL